MATWVDEDARFSCATVMRTAGISRNALINYERHGAVHPKRGENGYRAYDRGDLLDVMCCTMLTSMGYSVAEAAKLLSETGEGDLMSLAHIDDFSERLARQRDVAQAKLDNLAALRRTTAEALPAAEACFELVDCPEWLFFFDEHESGDVRDAKLDNQLELLRSVPLACRGFTIERFFTGSTPSSSPSATGARSAAPVALGRGSSSFASEPPASPAVPTLPAALPSPLVYRWGRTLRRSHERLLAIDTTRACVFGGPCARTALRADYPDLDPTGVLRGRLLSYLEEHGLRHIGDPFVPLLVNNRRPSPVFELFVPVEPIS